MRSVADSALSFNARSLARIDPAWLLVVPVILLVALFYLLPLMDVLTLSVTDPEPGFANYDRVLTARGPVRVLTTTMRICAITTAVTILLGFCVAMAIARLEGAHQRFLILCVVVPLWISVLVRGFSWLMLLGDTGIVNTWMIEVGLVAEPVQFVRNELGVIIGMVHYLLPYAILPILAVLRSIDDRLLFASRSLGAPPRTTFLRVYLPLALPGIFAATVIVFVFGLGFYVTPALLGGGRVVMLAESVSVSILTTARWGLGAAQAVVLLVLTMTLLGILAKTVGLKKGLS